MGDYLFEFLSLCDKIPLKFMRLDIHGENLPRTRQFVATKKVVNNLLIFIYRRWSMTGWRGDITERDCQESSHRVAGN